MNRIVLVGNGFDLHNGLKTDYWSFIRWYIHQALEHPECFEDNDSNLKISNFELLISRNLLDRQKEALRIVARVLESDSLIFNFYNEDERKEYTLEISPLIFLIINHIGSFGWSDIEADYFTLLQRQKDIAGTQSLNACFEDLRTNLIKYIGSQEDGLVKEDNFSSLFITNRIAHRFKSYLNYNLLDYSEKQIKGLKQPDEIERYEGLYDKIYFVNFNYTSYWHSQFTNFYEEELEIINIHGLIKDKKENPPFFGYGDDTSEEYAAIEKRVVSDNWAKYMKSIHYLRRYDYKQLLDVIDSKEFQVVVAGHSCGLSDKTLLKTIFEHKNCISIKPYFYKERDDDGNLTGKENWLSIIANISRIFSNNAMMRERVISRYDKEGQERPLTFDDL